MLRMSYLATLFALQCALVAQAGPPLWRGLRLETVVASPGAGAVDYAPLAVTGFAVLGVVLALSFPTIAWLRHCQQGELHFHGLPRWAVAIALTGAAILLAGCAFKWLAPIAPADWRTACFTAARFALGAGALAMTAGVLCAELLRRRHLSSLTEESP